MKKVIVLAGVVALLASLSAFADGDAAAGQQKAAVCAACHGVDGNSINPEWPKLAGQHASYFIQQLEYFALPADSLRARVNPLMSAQAVALSQQDREDLAAYYASQTIQTGAADPGQLAKGERLYRGGNLETGVSACTACHGPTGNGNEASGYPTLAGQHATYVEAQLRAYRAAAAGATAVNGGRTTDPAQIMRGVAGRLTDEEIRAVAQYVQGLHGN
ncbi:MAG: c-type cytochrome [Gammaproteobacteria bacterium]